LKERFWLIALDRLGSTPWVGSQLKEYVEPLIAAYPVPMAALAGALAGGLSAWPLGPWLYRRFFVGFDEEILVRLRKPQPFDPLRGALLMDGRLTPRAMHWVAPRPGTGRDAVWADLRRFTRCAPRSPAFGWALLVGRPGAGKSRLAVEYIRRELAKRDVSRSWHARAASWWRVQVRRKFPGENDPWDAGLLVPGTIAASGSTYPGWRGRKAVTPDWREKIAAWRPRRPTILLLDDPRPGEARDVVGALSRVSSRHPVRLLIVNQSEPADLNMRAASQQADGGGVLAPLMAPLVLADDSGWAAADLRVALVDIRRPAPRNHEPLVLDRTQVDHLIAITRGTPLLIELALMAILHGRPVESLTVDELLKERVERIELAIRDAGFPDNFDPLLALATLAGGVSKAHLADLRMVREEDIGDLSRLFPSETGDIRNVMPPVRPELIGDAFVDVAFARSQYSDDWRRRFVADAWTLNPAGTLRAALRIAGRDSMLGRALAAGPPDDAALDTVLVAAAFAEAACVLRPDDFGRRDDAVLLPSAEARARALAAQDAIALLSQLVALPSRLRRDEILLGPKWARLQCILLESALTTQTASEIETVAGVMPALFEAWRRCLGSNHNGLAELLPKPGPGPGKAMAASDLALLVDAAFAADAIQPQHELVAQFSELLAVHSGAFGAVAIDLEEHVSVLGKYAVLRRSSPNAAAFAAVVEKLGASASATLPVALGTARSQRAAAFASEDDAAQCRLHVDRVETIVAAWPNDRDMQHERAMAWRYMAYATKEDAAQCRLHAGRVETIVARWPDDRHMQLERAMVWRCVVFATNDDAAECRLHAERVEMIAAGWPDDREMQYERAHAWRDMAYATKDYPARCRLHVDRVEAIAVRWLGNPRIQGELVIARGFLDQS
jgi:hypothetical protein